MSQTATDPAPTEQNAAAQTLAPPTTLGGTLRRIGPGMILAGAIVGSGELIATTRTGAEAGFTLLWLILFGCIIKVFVQIELGRYSIVNGKTTLAALNTVPGPRLAIPLGTSSAKGNWITWFWLLMFLASIGQLGGIVGGVGQGMAIAFPLSEEGKADNQLRDDYVTLRIKQAQLALLQDHATRGDAAASPERIAALQAEIAALTPRAERMTVFVAWQAKDGELAALKKKLNIDQPTGDALRSLKPEDAAKLQALAMEASALKEQSNALGAPAQPMDSKYWALILGVVTSFMLVLGKYKFIEVASIVMVATFTLVTIGNVLALQAHDEWMVRASDIAHGFSFQFPHREGALLTALAAFGIIGVGASELMAYPYWCIEKGYARFTGPRDGTPSWFSRAKGWLRVMKVDAFCCMVIYTVATVAFYLLGAAILGRTGIKPGDDDQMIRTLTTMYEPVFGKFAPTLFLIGAFAVLYSTYFSATAANSRQAADVIDAFGIQPLDDRRRRMWVRFFCGLFPMVCVAIYWLFPKPVTLVLLSGVMQALLLPMLGVAALYFRYKRCDEELKPGKLWDLMLWISFTGFFIVGVYLAQANIRKWVG